MADDPLLEENNLVLLQQIIATDWALLPFEELEYLNPEKTPTNLRDTLATLHRYGYITIITTDSENGMPDTFYAATINAKEQLQEYGIWDGLGILYQVYSSVETPDHLVQSRESYPEGPLVKIAQKER